MLDSCIVVLARSMFGGNVGAAARAVKNTGLGGLRLVGALFEDGQEAVMFAHGAEDVLEGAQRFDQLGDAVRGFVRVVGFTARRRQRRRIASLRDFARAWMEAALSAETPDPTALVFGNERDGLTTTELDHCTELVWIPAHPDHPSYNLAQSVLLAGYELFQARLERDAAMPAPQPRQTRSPRSSPPARADELDELFAHLREAFLAVGYGYPHTVDPTVRSYRELLTRAEPMQREVQMLRGLARQMIWVAAQRGDDQTPSE